MTAPLLAARLTHTYPSLTLDASVTAAAGSVVALLGPSGAGKTTCLRMLAGLVPDAGPGTHITVGADVWQEGSKGRPPEQRRVGLVLADPLLFPHLSVLENVAFGLTSRGMGKAPALERARRELALVGLADRATERPSNLSTGQAARVALARALAVDPALLLLDEPLSALDPVTRSGLRAALAGRLRTFEGATILVTHDPLDALTLADHLVFLDDGVVTQTGSPAEVVARPQSRFAASVVGLNLYAATIDPAHPNVAHLDQVTEPPPAGEAPPEQEGGLAVVLPGPLEAAPTLGSTNASDSSPGTPVWVGIRPSAITLHETRPEGSARNLWHTEITHVDLIGQTARVTCQGTFTLIAEVTVDGLAALRLTPGRRIWAAVKATQVTAYPRL